MIGSAKGAPEATVLTTPVAGSTWNSAPAPAPASGSATDGPVAEQRHVGWLDEVG